VSSPVARASHHGRQCVGVDANRRARDGDRHRDLVVDVAQQPQPGKLTAAGGALRRAVGTLA